MKPMLKTLVIVAFVSLLVQTVRHAYMLWFEPRGSVLDKYDQPVKSEIASAVSLNELLRRYDPVRKQVDELSKTRDRKSTRLNSSHSQISYAVFCLKKKKKSTTEAAIQPSTSYIMICYGPALLPTNLIQCF